MAYAGDGMKLALSLGVAAITANPVPALEIQSGSGYAGSVYSYSPGGQWTADGAAIAGATGTNWTMTAAHEGAAIRCGDSNVIQMWTPLNGLTAGQKANGGLWLASAATVASGRVVSIADGFGQRSMDQSVAAKQPIVATVGTLPAMQFDQALGDFDLRPSEAFSPVWVVMLLQYGDGVQTSGSAQYSQIISNGIASPGGRVSVQPGASGFQPSTAVSACRVNGKDDLANFPLPMPMGSVSFDLAGSSVIWSMGRGLNGFTDRSWFGYIAAALMLGEVPNDMLRWTIEGYVHWRHGLETLLQPNHPYRNTAPRLQ